MATVQFGVSDDAVLLRLGFEAWSATNDQSFLIGAAGFEASLGNVYSMSLT